MNEFNKSLLKLSVLVLSSFFTSTAYPQSSDTLILKQGLALQLFKGYSETIISPNPVEADLVTGRWRMPENGGEVIFANGQRGQWRTITTDSAGWFEDSVLSGCYISFQLEKTKDQVMILEGMGNEMVYLNGVPRSGNPYGMKENWEAWEPNFQYSRLPVSLEKGRNELLFRCQRGRFKAILYPPAGPVTFNPRDITVPDFVSGEEIDTWGSIVVVNATAKPLKDLEIKTAVGNAPGSTVQVPVIQPLSVRKVNFQVRSGLLSDKGNVIVGVTLFRKDRNAPEILDTVSIPFRVVDFGSNRKETFISKIDGSVQYYGINPAIGSTRVTPEALFLSLHGAAVEGINQSGSYYPKKWGHIVAPTNRRPYGFNWEEWGRIDAMETIDIIKQRYSVDENRVYLTGHSMGGHGVWHIGSIYPDQFAAIGPSAGWISFWTYRFRGQNLIDTSEIRKMIRRATTPSETFMHLNNYRQHGVYILHGSDDDNVSPDQARMMAEELKKVHNDFVFHEQKGAGHWWDVSDEPGADCVDWAPMFDFFARHARPQKERVREISFQTSNPGISSKNNWLTIDAQDQPLKMSSVNVRFDPGLIRFAGSTSNVQRLSFDTDFIKLYDTVTVNLDGQVLKYVHSNADKKKLWLALWNGSWIVAEEPPANLKGSLRNGTLKEAFRNKMIFVFGTTGSGGENLWAFNKARYDAEKFWYQGNGSIDVIPDHEFDPLKNIDRNVILYGNRNTNSAWNKLLADSPVQVANGAINIGGKKISSKELCCIFVYPRKGSKNASVAAISGTGLVGMRMTNRLPYLNPGIGLPDCTVLSPELLTEGENGVIMTGFFGNDWSVENGDFIWQTKK